MSSHFEDLNYNQKEAVFSEKKRICVIAGPGCGKTKTLIARICRIVKENSGDKLLVLTFGKKAICEIKERSSRLLGTIGNKVKISNIHSFCYEFLQKHHNLLEFSNEEFGSFGVCDSDLQKSFIKESISRMEEINFDEKNLSQIIKEISLFKLKVFKDLSNLTKSVYIEYERILREQNYFDFSDLLIYTLALLESNEKLRKHYQKKFDHVLVDEFQDINEIQWQIIRNLSHKRSENSLFVVGDPNQCIYGFQGSAPQIIESFLKDKEWNIYYLKVNYRSTGNVVKFSNNFLFENKHHLVQNTLKAVKDEGEFVSYKNFPYAQNIVDLVKELSYSYDISQIAVIYRSNYLSAWIEKDLIKREIPYEILGAYKFLQRSEVKDVISYLRSVINSDNSSFIRVFSLLQGIGKKTIEIIENESKNFELKTLDFLIEQSRHSKNAKDSIFELKIKNPRKVNLIKNFVETFSRLKEKLRSEGNISFFFEETLSSFGYLKYIGEKFGEERLMNIKQLINMSKKWEEENQEKISEMSIKDKTELFLNYLFLSFVEEDSSQFKKIKKLTISNVHQVKGLEFNIVIFAYLDKGILPSLISQNDDEEKRIFYVGITRAKEKLYLFSSGKPSIFLNNIENLPYVNIS